VPGFCGFSHRCLRSCGRAPNQEERHDDLLPSL
jgi:hypothetical protein